MIGVQNYLLLKVLPDLIVHLELLLELLELLFFHVPILDGVVRRWNGRAEKVEK
jgi:hypothetical protein